MSVEANIALVEECYEKFRSGDIPGMLALLSPEIDWTTPKIEGAEFTGHRTGVDAIGEFFEKLHDAEEFSRFEPLEYIAQNDKVVVLGESAATIKSTGNELESEWVHIFEIRDGKVARFNEFFDSAKAEKAYRRTSTALA